MHRHLHTLLLGHQANRSRHVAAGALACDCYLLRIAAMLSRVLKRPLISGPRVIVRSREFIGGSELEELFNSQDKSKDATSIPATFLRVTVAL